MNSNSRQSRIARCAKARMDLTDFRQFADKVCKDVCKLAGCSFQMWDSAGNRITSRHKPHRLCEWLEINVNARINCQEDDIPAVRQVLDEGNYCEYVCWAGFTCFMVPIRAFNSTVGAISVGEFLTHKNPQLTEDFWETCADLNISIEIIEAEAFSGKIRLFDTSEIDSLKATTSFLAQVIGDIISDRLAEDNFGEYFDKLHAKIEQLPTDLYGQQLAVRMVLALSSLLLRRAQTLSEHLRQMRLHHLLTPLTELTYIAETISDQSSKNRAIDLIRECDHRIRHFVTPDETLATLWLEGTSKERVSVNKILKAVSDGFKDRLDPSDTLTVDAKSNLTMVAAPLHIKGIVENLLDNAIKSSDPPRRISVTGKHIDDAIIIEVTDNGCGMDSNQIFNHGRPGTAGKSFIERGRAGVGLGLRLVRDLAAKNWGTMNIQSELNKGTSVKIAFTQMEASDESNEIDYNH